MLLDQDQEDKIDLSHTDLMTIFRSIQKAESLRRLGLMCILWSYICVLVYVLRCCLYGVIKHDDDDDNEISHISKTNEKIRNMKC